MISFGVNLTTENFEAFSLFGLTGEVKSKLLNLETLLEGELADAAFEQYSLGARVDNAALAAAGLEDPRGRDTIADQSAVYVTAAASRIRESIAQLGDSLIEAIADFALGNTSLAKLLKAMDSMIGDFFERHLKPLVATELSAAFSEGQQQSQLLLQDALGGGVFKKWVLHRKASRRGHRQVAETTRIKPIPVNSHFVVLDYSYVGLTQYLTVSHNGRKHVARVPTYARRGSLREDLMQYPRDPSAALSNRIHCRCMSQTVIGDFQLLDQPGGENGESDLEFEI